jgi:hypothetical protein
MATIADMTRLKVPAREVQAGDWTTFSGSRLVVEVRFMSRKRIGLVRVNGKLDRQKFNYDDDVIVYREQNQREETQDVH